MLMQLLLDTAAAVLAPSAENASVQHQPLWLLTEKVNMAKLVPVKTSGLL